MKKITKILSLIVVVVVLAGILCGCALFGRNTAKYRDQVVVTVGNESVKLGKVIDRFNTNYSTYYSYIQQGYMTIDDLFNSTMASLYITYAKLDKYKSTSENNPTYTSAQNSFVVDGGIENMKYLNQVEANFAVSYAKYSLFKSFDTFVESYIDAEVGKLATATEDTSRDFLEFDNFDELGVSATSYAEYLFHQSMINDDVDEYFEKYYGVDYLNDALSLDYDDYIFANATEAAAAVENYNKLLKQYVDEQDEDLEDDYEYPEITATQLIDWQKMAVNKYEKNVKNAYDFELLQFFKNQIADIVVSVVVSKYDLKNNLLVENATDFLQNIKKRFDESVKALQTDYGAKPDAYVSFIEGLTNESYIYDIPSIYSGKYIYVKNLLVPFTDYQKTQLSNWEAIVGSDTDAYKAKQLELAKEILARDFLIADEDDDDAFVADFFDIVGGDLVLKDQNLSSFFESNKSSGVFGGSAADFVELMKQYNTDVGQHSTLYDYVVRIGETPESYTAQWVSEFVDAANDAWTKTDIQNGEYGYSICVSQFGVHIVYVSGVVEAWDTFDQTKIYDTTSNEYRYLKTYYSAVQSTYVNPIIEALEKEYMNKDNPKIAVTAEFDKFLEELGIEYDFESNLKEA